MNEYIIIGIALGIILTILILIFLKLIKESKELKKGKSIEKRSTKDIRRMLK